MGFELSSKRYFEAIPLKISKRTVDEHSQTAARKLGAANRTQAVAIALGDRIIQV